MNDKALIIDGHNFLFRGFYGVPPQAVFTDGTKVNAIYGFFSLLRTAMKEVTPSYLVIVFDSESSADLKKSAVPAYKANRVVQDDNIFEQLEIIKRCLDLLGVYWIEDDSNEADDVIGSLAERFTNDQKSVFICSNDNDFIQLIKEDIFVIRRARGKNFIFDLTNVQDKYGICPHRYLDYLALVGDKGDNVPGVKGIGKKYANQMITEYGDVASLIRSIHILPSHLQKKMFGKECEIISRKEFLMINTAIPLPTDFALSKCSLNEDPLPDKMGSFLRKNWHEISS